MSFLHSGLKNSGLRQKPWQFVGAFLLLLIAAVSLWYGLKVYLSSNLDEQELVEEEAGPVDEATRQDMLSSRDEAEVAGTEDETGPVEDDVKESFLAPREPSPDPVDNEPISEEDRKSFLE